MQTLNPYRKKRRYSRALPMATQIRENKNGEHILILGTWSLVWLSIVMVSAL